MGLHRNDNFSLVFDETTLEVNPWHIVLALAYFVLQISTFVTFENPQVSCHW
jgi:hypothetical protein